MNRHQKLTTRQESAEKQQQISQQQTQPVQEFATVEELLRHDALHTPVPPRLEARLQEAVENLPGPARPWWRRLFGK